MKYFLTTCILACLISCENSTSLEAQSSMERTAEFDNYWFKSKAEVTSYTLEQTRYGENHKGQATLIFVTEPFNTAKNVKSDNGIGNNVQSVLKLNHVRKFNTGIYPYSIMTSTFTPVSQTGAGQTFKITNSVQEWCGQVYSQMEKKGNQYDVNSYSYFESEGDSRFQVKSTLHEDEFMTLIRINPAIIKEGEYDVLPASHYIRLLHKKMKPYKASITISEIEKDGVKLVSYSIFYPSLKRKFTVVTTKSFPYAVEEWSEEYSALNGRPMVTRAVKNERMLIDYWNKNKNSDRILYDELFDGI